MMGGFDARAIESIPSLEEADLEEGSQNLDRVWAVQCKREKSIAPKKMGQYAEALPEGVYGVIFAAACDFSKKTRDVFGKVAREKGYGEYILLGRAELEDMLLQPKNDHLLFAFFGISLQMRRRSLKSKIQNKLTVKNKLLKIFPGPDVYASVLIRNPSDETYPYKKGDKQHWMPCTFLRYYYNGIVVRVVQRFAFLENDHKGWDYVPGVNAIDQSINHYWLSDADNEKNSAAHEIWWQLPEENRAWLYVDLFFPFESVIAVDKDGDEYFRDPHIFVLTDNNWQEYEYTAEIVTQPNYPKESIKLEMPQQKDRTKFFSNKRRVSKTIKANQSPKDSKSTIVKS